jgi:hypothetical protein
VPVGNGSDLAVAGLTGLTGTETGVSVLLRRNTGRNARATWECRPGALVDMAVEHFRYLANLDAQLGELFRENRLHTVGKGVFGLMMYFN